MPVTLERKPLFDALRLLRQVAPGRNTIPILSNVRLRTEGDTLQVTATDLDRWLTATIEVTDQDEPMDLTVQTARLSAFVSALPNGAEIRLTERPKTRRLDVAAGTAIRFEPGQTREVTLIPFTGGREIYGFRAEVMGKL